MIVLDGVTVTYGNHLALRDVHLRVPPGVVLGLVGPNGGGKSTLLKTIGGLVSPRRGQVRVGGMPVEVAQRRGWLAYVPQTEPVDGPCPLTVQEVVMMGRYGHLNGLRLLGPRDRQVVQASLQQVGLWPWRHRPLAELSGGQRKRVFLARALAQQAPVLLLDEPFNGVDGPTERVLVQWLRQGRRQGQTVLIASHDGPMVAALCDRVVLLQQTVLADGTPTDLQGVWESLWAA